MSTHLTLSTVGEIAVCGGAFAAVFYPLVARLERRQAGHRQTTLEQAAKDAVSEGLTEFRADVTRRFDANDRTSASAAAESRKTNDRLIKLETVQFGGNGGGIREQVNNTDRKVDELTRAVEHLGGQFEEHTKHCKPSGSE